MNKLSCFALVFSLAALSLALFAAFSPRPIQETERERIRNEVYQSLVKEVDDEMAPIYKEMGIKAPTDEKLSSRLRPLLQPLSK